MQEKGIDWGQCSGWGGQGKMILTCAITLGGSICYKNMIEGHDSITRIDLRSESEAEVDFMESKSIY